MKRVLLAALVMLVVSPVLADDATDIEARNKAAALGFFEDLWLSKNTDNYTQYLAETYVVHDLGERKGVTEEAVSQKDIADFFHSLGEMTGEIDWQIADGDKVATRWFLSLKAGPRGQAMGMTDFERVAIINVFRFNEEGKIVEIWNHRHDPELPQPQGPPPE